LRFSFFLLFHFPSFFSYCFSFLLGDVVIPVIFSGRKWAILLFVF
jgi:hypothetical protein